MTPSQEPVDVFLCHTGANKDFVRDLASKLEGEEIDGCPLRVFFDEWDIAPGENILTRIDEGLRSARYFVVALSPALTKAAWPTMEWQTQVYDDPNGKRGRIIPIIVEKYDAVSLEPLEIPPVLRLLRYLDFSRPERFRRAYEELLRRVKGLRPGRGVHSAVESATAVGLLTGPEAADPVDEVLLANLFPVTRLPAFVFSDKTTATGYGPAWRAMSGPLRIPFILHNERLYTFIPPDAPENPFPSFLTGEDPRREPTVEWMKQQHHAMHIVWMCNDALKERCYSLKINTAPKDRKQFFVPSFDGKPRHFTWGSGKPVTLAKVSTTGQSPLGIHRSARMRFMMLGEKPHLLIEPGYFFTTDGVTALEGRQVGVLSVKWGGREGNDVVFRQTMMWARLLAVGTPTIELPVGGKEVIAVSPIPIHARASLGVADDGGNIERLLAGEMSGEMSVDGDDDLDAAATALDEGSLSEADETRGTDEAGLTDVADLDADREDETEVDQ